MHHVTNRSCLKYRPLMLFGKWVSKIPDSGIGFTTRGVRDIFGITTAFSIDRSNFDKKWYHLTSQFLLVICAKL